MTPRLTPVDILNKRFSRRISGYHTAETDAFLRQAATDLESVLLENAAQREQLAAQERELTRYRSLENTMRDALILGQKAADDLRAAARAQAAAQIEAAQNRVESLSEQTERLRLDRRRMAHEMRALLESQMAWLDYELTRDATQVAVASRIETSENAPAALSAHYSGDGRALPLVSSAEYVALTSYPGEFEADSQIESQDRTASRNGASDAVPSENA